MEFPRLPTLMHMPVAYTEEETPLGLGQPWHSDPASLVLDRQGPEDTETHAFLCVNQSIDFRPLVLAQAWLPTASGLWLPAPLCTKC